MLESKHSILLEKIKIALAKYKCDVLEGLKASCDLLRIGFNHYDWVGFYFSDFKTETLHLKVFSGIPTDHTVIPFGKGICGQVAVSNENFMVPDVKEQDNYIACNINVKSELVVPLFLDEKNIGQIDVDSNEINPFSKEDELLLEACCDLISKTYSYSLLSL